MTNRLETLLNDLAAGAPPVPNAEYVWQRARRTRRERAVISSVAVAAAAAILIAAVPGSLHPQRSQFSNAPGDGAPVLPPRIEQPYGTIPSLRERPVDRVIMTVEARLQHRTVFIPRKTNRSGVPAFGYLAVGPDHAYRTIADSPTFAYDGTTATASPDGLYLAVPVKRTADGRTTFALLDATGRYEGPQYGGAPGRIGRFDNIPDVECAGVAGWTRDNDFACIVSKGSLATVQLYSIPVGGGLVASAKINWNLRSNGGNGPSSAPVTPATVHVAESAASAADIVALGSDHNDPAAVILQKFDGTITRSIHYPGATNVSPVRWCGNDTVLVEVDGSWSVLALDGTVRSRMAKDADWTPLGCRADGSVAADVNGGAYWYGIRLFRPDGTIAGDVGAPRQRITADSGGPLITSFAIDAVSWSVGGSPARATGFYPKDWQDEGILGLVLLLGSVGMFLRRRRS